jgi:hypothetical protein
MEAAKRGILIRRDWPGVGSVVERGTRLGIATGKVQVFWSCRNLSCIWLIDMPIISLFNVRGVGERDKFVAIIKLAQYLNTDLLVLTESHLTDKLLAR